MLPETLEALRGSIRKWEKIVAGKGKDRGPDNCPLCQLFNTLEMEMSDRNCIGCPVAEKTGKIECIDSPYDDYVDNPSIENARAELEFLRSLLPPEEQEHQSKP